MKLTQSGLFLASLHFLNDDSQGQACYLKISDKDLFCVIYLGTSSWASLSSHLPVSPQYTCPVPFKLVSHLHGDHVYIYDMCVQNNVKCQAKDRFLHNGERSSLHELVKFAKWFPKPQFLSKLWNRNVEPQLSSLLRQFKQRRGALPCPGMR